MVVGIGGRLWRPLLTGPAGPGRAGPVRPRLDAGAVRVVDLVLALTVLLAVAGADRTFVRTPLSDLPGRCVCISGYRPGPSRRVTPSACLYLLTRGGAKIFLRIRMYLLLRGGAKIYLQNRMYLFSRRGAKMEFPKYQFRNRFTTK